MTPGTFGSHSFIPFIASQFITDFGRFGQHRHDPTPVLPKLGMPSNTRGTIEGTRTERGIP